MQYRTGTVSINYGSQLVTGTNTMWLSAIPVNKHCILTIPNDNKVYYILQVASNTSLYISPTYEGSTVSNSPYAIVTDYTFNYEWPTIARGDIDWPRILSESLYKIDRTIYETPKIKTLTMTPQSSAPLRVESGMIYFNNSTKKLMVYVDNEVGWKAIQFES